jgi:shikimate dehydrogenase
MNVFGLVGKKLLHSFSKEYFTKKFFSIGLDDCEYRNFEIEDNGGLSSVFDIEGLRGFNVTVPYKKAIIPFLDSCSREAAAVGAVNTVALENGKWVGHNTDVAGFEKSFMPVLYRKDSWADMPLRFCGRDKTLSANALIFGTGGASAAVQYVLKKNSIPFTVVGRGENVRVRYSELTTEIMQQHNILINTTPVGMYPNTEDILPVLYDGIAAGVFAFDLIYNPAETVFLREARLRGAVTKNGLEMLHLQAEEAWRVWQANAV